jgi:D-beta-D-heptose 7-phosphate kinase/D-beta-D-heptose 1-phosphate adenosyltransferase
VNLNFQGLRVIVVGDIMLDIFSYGSAIRLSPEAPVPVVKIDKEVYSPGGASNVARNITSLGGQAILFGVLGGIWRDNDLLTDALENANVDISNLVVDDRYITPIKNRIIAQNQQIVRIDKEQPMKFEFALYNRLVSSFDKEIKNADVVILEDYAKGIFHPDFFNTIKSIANNNHKIIVADPNINNNLDYSDITVITPNRKEAAHFANRQPNEAADFIANSLADKWKNTNILITLSEDGMLLCDKDLQKTHIPSIAQQVFDVSGAGDTVVAALGLSLASGHSLIESCKIANHAAGIVVGKKGTSTCSIEELKNSIDKSGQ